MASDGSLFSALDPPARAEFGDRYRRWLLERDGRPDVEQGLLPNREILLATLGAEPLPEEGSPLVDQAVFDRNQARARPEPGLDEATLWALATAKANRGEAYGVERALRSSAFDDGPEGTVEAHIALQERYHTRILRDAVEAVGARMSMLRPPLITRVAISLMINLPRSASGMLILGGEIAGVVVFRFLRAKGRQLLRHRPRTSARVDALFRQILEDEVGHVHHVRSTLGPARLAAARRLLPVVATTFLDGVPELYQLFGRDRLLQEIVAAHIPFDMRQASSELAQ